MNFMLPVPEASVPAVEICCDRSAAGMAGSWQNKRVDDTNKHSVFVSYGESWLETSSEGERKIFEYTHDLVITFLCQCNSVVLQKDDFETVSNHRIIVDHFTNSCDQTNNHLGSVVSRSSLQEIDSF